MRRKPADDLVSYGLFGSHEAAPAKRNDVEAELVATIGRPVMRPQRLLAALWPRNRSSITETGATLTRLFGFQFQLNRVPRRSLTNHHPTMIVTLAHKFLCSDWNLGTCISLE
jgi:hypothetical protein